MNSETKENVKKNATSFASTAAGATVGVVIGSAITPETAQAAEMCAPDVVDQTVSDSDVTVQMQPEPDKQDVVNQEPVNQNTEATVQTSSETAASEPEMEVEVLGYDRMTNDDGSQMDVAVLNVNGREIGVIDANLDGMADAMVCDVNQNGVIENGEMENLQGQGLPMQPFQDAAGFNPQFAQNDLPDYVNDANVDTYMA